MLKYLSQNQVPIGDPIQGIGTYGTGGSGSPGRFTNIITKVIGILTLVAGIWFIFLLISGGIQWMSSGGDKGKLAAARSNMISGAIGLAIIIAALFIAEIFGSVFGLPDILNPSALISNLGP